MIQPLLIPTAAEKRIDTDFYVEGYATTFDKPYLLYEWDGNKYYERIDRNALAGADMSDVIMQYNHEGKVLARLSNGTLGVEANDMIERMRKGRCIYAKTGAGAERTDGIQRDCESERPCKAHLHDHEFDGALPEEIPLHACKQDTG